MKKRTLAVTLAVLMGVLSLTACGSKQEEVEAPAQEAAVVEDEEAEEAPAEEVAEEEINLAYFGPHQDNEYQISLREAAEAAAVEQGVNMKVYIADNDAAKQISQIEQAIAEGVDGIVIDPCSFEGITAGVRAAKDAGIPFVTVHELVSIQDECTAFVGSDLFTGGKLKMEQVMADFPDGAQLALLYGPLGHTAQLDITNGYAEALKDQEDKYVTVFDGVGNWAAEDALELVSNWLSTGKQIDAIVCNNDGMAIGALQAVKAAGKEGEILIYGLDAQQDVLTEVKAGTIRATIFNDFVGEASVGVELCLKAIRDEEVEPTNMISPKVVTIDNVDEYLK